MGDNMESLEGGCVIVANGRFPSAELPLRLLKEAKTIIACDGAVKTLYEKGIHPDAIVGDLDSIPAGLRERYADRIHHVEDQEINDLTKSVRFAHTQGYREVLILGATGLREGKAAVFRVRSQPGRRLPPSAPCALGMPPPGKS